MPYILRYDSQANIAFNQVAKEIGAVLLIDDHPHHCLPCAQQDPPIQALCFGDYTFQKYKWPAADDGLTWEEMQAAGIPLPPVEIDWFVGDHVARARDWNAVVEWVRNWKREPAAAAATTVHLEAADKSRDQSLSDKKTTKDAAEDDEAPAAATAEPEVEVVMM